MRDDEEPDPTRVTEQPSLTQSSGTIWLVVGGLMAAISVVLLWTLQQVNSTGIAIAAIVTILLAYVAMVEVRLLVRRLRLRLGLMAACFGLIAAIALVAVIVIGWSAGSI